MQARLRAAIAHAAIARAAIARATIARAAPARAQPTYSIVWRQNTGGLRAARVLSSVVRRRWQADNRCDGDGRWAMDNMRSAWIVVAILVRACAVFFLFSIMYNTSTYPLYLPVYNILTYHVAPSLSYSYVRFVLRSTMFFGVRGRVWWGVPGERGKKREICSKNKRNKIIQVQNIFSRIKKIVACN